MKRVLVAGASGCLGLYVARKLGRRGYFVRALVRSPDRLNDSVRNAANEVVQAEVTRPGTLEHVCDGIDVVEKFIYVPSARPPAPTGFPTTSQSSRRSEEAAMADRIARIPAVRRDGHWPVSTPAAQGLDSALVARLYADAAGLETASFRVR